MKKRGMRLMLGSLEVHLHDDELQWNHQGTFKIILPSLQREYEAVRHTKRCFKQSSSSYRWAHVAGTTMRRKMNPSREEPLQDIEKAPFLGFKASGEGHKQEGRGITSLYWSHISSG
jgi:hypothetical protein